MHSNKNTSALCLLVVFMFIAKVICQEQVSIDSNAVSAQNELFTIFGKVNIRVDELDLENTRILVDDGQYVGFLRADGTFTIPGFKNF
jgi:hypothetical protein